MNGNDTIRKLLLDEKVGEVLELYKRCDINSFLEIEKYYSGGCMELNENNICDILRFSIYYNDNRIMLICKKYLKTHMNESIMIEIFSILNGLNHQKLNDLKEMSEGYIRLNGYNYLNEDSLLLKLNLNSMKFILNNDKLIIDDETWLLNRLLLWHREVLKVKEENEEERKEEIEEFVSIIKSQIHLNEIVVEDVTEENLLELSELKISINDYTKIHIKIKMDEVNNVEVKKLIHKYYLKEIEEEEEMKIEENDLEKLKNEEMKSEMIKLLSNEDIKIVEIVLIIILEMRTPEIIPKEIKNRILRELLYEYGRSKRNLSLKCLCLFVDDNKYISTIECLCGKEILYTILNNEFFLNSKSKELLIEYIQDMKLDEKEEEEMSKIIVNEELLEELLIKEIISFSYPHSEYSFEINEEISIIPSFDGTKCDFSISPPLPLGLKIDKETGIINGKVENKIEKKEYEIICKNMRNEKKFKMSLEIDVKFTELNKSDNISISNNEKLMTKTEDGSNHCYLNLRMENGIYHIKYQFHQNQSNSSFNEIMIGLSTNNTYSGNDIHYQSTTCNYYAYSGKSQDVPPYYHIGRVVNSDPNFNNHGDGSIYEVIVDMNKREFWISHNDSSPVLLIKDLPSPLYPYVEPYRQYTSVELLSFSHQD